MKFEQALEAMREGAEVRLPHWDQQLSFRISKNDRSLIVSFDGEEEFKRWGIAVEDIMSEDWEIVRR